MPQNKTDIGECHNPRFPNSPVFIITQNKRKKEKKKKQGFKCEALSGLWAKEKQNTLV